MAKVGKKRRREGSNLSVELSSNVKGFTNEISESVADCLAEFSQPVSAIPAGKDTDPKSEATNEKSDGGNSPYSTPDINAIEAWNSSIKSWSNKGSYTPGLLPSIDEELTRNYKVKELSSFILSLGKEIRMPTFERWLIDAKLEEKNASQDNHQSDPILPQNATGDYEASQRLIEELRSDGGLTKEQAQKAVGDLCRKSSLFAQEMISQTSMYCKQAPIKKGDWVRIENKGGDVLKLVYSRKKWKKPFHADMNRSHYDRIKERFLSVHNKAATKLDLAATSDSKKKDSLALQAFHVLLVALLLRYSSLSGGQLLQDLRGGGMQGAIHAQVFDLLKKTFRGPFIEGFASPFNAYLPTFASAFPDIEWHFGSIGIFLESSIQSGCCEVNPPFSCGLMSSMVDKIDRLLLKADENKRDLTFVIVVPTADNSTSSKSKSAVAKAMAAESFRRMTSDRHCRHHVILRAREHGYIEGSQHLRPTQYKQSSYDTSVILMQSKLAKSQPLDIDRFDESIRSAFASKHEEETEQRKRQKKIS